MTKKILICVLAVLMLLVCVACSDVSAPHGQGTTPADTTTHAVTEPPIQKVSVALTGDVSYKIIRSENADEQIAQIGSDMWNRLHDITGNFDIRIADDFVKNSEDASNDDKEILLGLTNRPESSEALDALPTYLDYSISVVGNKIVIAANTAERLAEAADYFVSCVVMQDGVAVYNNDEVVVNSYCDYKYKDLTISGKKISDYVIVIPKDGATEAAFAKKLALWFATSCGYMPAIVDDSTSPAESEIVIGVTARNTGVTAAGLDRGDCKIKTVEGGLVMVALTSGGYKFSMEKLEEMLGDGGKLAVGTEQLFVGDNSGLDGARVMFIGNSFTYYGHCCGSKEDNPLGSVDKRYFYQVAKDYGDEVTVTNFTVGGASLWHKKGKVAEKSLYNKLIENYPNYYQNPSGKPMDAIYQQDHVILQQSGDNISETYTDAKAIMALFPPETKFYFYITTHDLSSNHTPTIQAAEKMQSDGTAEYIPLGHLVYKVWNRKEKIEGSTVRYNKSTFIVNQSSSDGYHPNHLTGYLTALMTYCTITGRSAEGADYSFVVQDDKTYYTNGTTNYPEVLNSSTDMAALQKLIDQYIQQYNQK